jgi:predicted transcriptional regulator
VPSKLGAGDVAHTKWITALVPADMRDRLDALAEKNDRNRSAELRIALREHLDKHERKAA